MQYWMAVATGENSERLAQLGYPFYALKTTPSVQPSDRCILYRSGVQRGFIGDFEFLSRPEPAQIRLGDYRTFTVKLPWKAIALTDQAPIDIRPLVEKLTFIKNKGLYSMALRTTFRVLAKADYELLSNLIARSVIPTDGKH